jgi:hypothetical protein
MKRIARVLPLIALLTLVASAVRAAPLTTAEKQATLEYVERLRNEDEGFRAAAAAGPSTLSATNTALRSIKYLGGQKLPPVQRFLTGCTDPSGGFVDMQGGAVDVRTTAMGLMVAAESKSRLVQDTAYTIREYFEKHAATIPDLYFATASLDAAGLKVKKAPEWVKAFEGTLNADGTYGKGPMENAGVAISLLRLGAALKDPAAVGRSLKAAQQADGGFSASGEKSDLGTTYRMVRALYMLKEKPDLELLRAFIAKCRNADGGYGVSPGQASTNSGTYNAAIVSFWLDDLEKK